jgi:adenylate cyclase class IV
MNKQRRKHSYLIDKKDIANKLGYSSMTMVYKKVLTAEIIKQLGFKSVIEFKKIRKFNLHQSRVIIEFLDDLLSG